MRKILAFGLVLSTLTSLGSICFASRNDGEIITAQSADLRDELAGLRARVDERRARLGAIENELADLRASLNNELEAERVAELEARVTRLQAEQDSVEVIIASMVAIITMIEINIANEAV